MQACVSEEYDYFQQLILNEIQKQISELIAIQGGDDSDFQVVLQDNLCKNLSWTETLSMKQKFCWGLVADCCSKIHIQQDSLEWMGHNRTVAHIGSMYHAYCSSRKLTDNQSIIIDQLPLEIQECPSQDAKRLIT